MTENSNHNNGNEKDLVSWDDRNLSLLSHLSGLLFFPLGGFNVFIPVAIYLLKSDVSPFISHHAKQAAIFQIVMAFLIWISGGLGVILWIMTFFILFPLLFLPIIVIVVYYIFVLKATFASHRGEWYSYPFMEAIE